MRERPDDADKLLTPAQVAAILYVDPRTVSRWAVAGKITAIRTPGGHRRYLSSEIAGLRHDASRRPPEPTPAGARDGSAAGDVVVVADAVALAADQASAAAATARQERALAARLAAETVARHAEQSAAAMQRGADVAARRLAEAASLAAALVAEAVAPGTERQDALTALRLAVVVQEAAVATAGDTAAAATFLATAVAAAAVEVALVVSAADLAIESEVARTARTLQVVASAAAREVASLADVRGTPPSRDLVPAGAERRVLRSGAAVRRAAPTR